MAVALSQSCGIRAVQALAYQKVTCSNCNSSTASNSAPLITEQTAHRISFQGMLYLHTHFSANLYSQITGLVLASFKSTVFDFVSQFLQLFHLCPCHLLSPWPSHRFIESADDFDSDSVGSQSHAGRNSSSTQTLTSAITTPLSLVLTVLNVFYFPCLSKFSSPCHSHPLHLLRHRLLLLYNTQMLPSSVMVLHPGWNNSMQQH